MIIKGDEPITIIRRSSSGTVDDYGNAVYETTQIIIRDGLFAFSSTEEPVDVAREAVDAKLTLYLPHGTEIIDGDVFVIRETQWVKDGDGAGWPVVNGFVPGVVVNVRRRRG